jgi:hypothetical protein
MYKNIQEKKIDILDQLTMDTWIEEEIISLANDFDQRLSDDMLLHICKRLREVLITKYKSWSVGSVHAIFQTGLSGGYGKYQRISVKALFNWLSSAQNQLTHLRCDNAEAESNRKNREIINDSPETEFLIWASTNKICLDHINPGFNPLKEKKVSPGIRELSQEYHEAKQMACLKAFKKRLINERLNLIEQ